ncbi:peptidylprolyl isomerase [Rhizobiaceae bacterium n13]|uniref:Parvulin-like PPIase n=1 Tax=Ferirhizobium litorale TaxID=2927786 RepID=A0AAE3QIL6_9HYPH|nr:peptidylprolyl isomerase [Fererhizobium litorale]MDI7864265.1 peptidylprolyl isomerase [Fererhizobium litorale]MDI7924630.1 peptidylprolyl isomerase [Fererhizobium litorale]
MLNYNKLAVVTLAAFIGFQAPVFAEEKTDAVVAKVGDVEIHQSDLDLAISNLDPQLAQLSDEQKRVAALSGAIDMKLLAKSATDEKLDQTPEYKARMEQIGERELHNAYFKKHVVDVVTPEEVKARYEKEIADLPKQEEVRARHILVKTEDEAKAVIADLDAGKDFATLAKEKSSDPSKSEGGDLGYFGKGRMVPEFEAAAFALEKGTYTKAPVKSQFGYHVIFVEDKRIAPPPAFEQVEPQVRQLVMRDMYLELLDAAKQETKVEIVDEAMKKAYDEANK